MLLAATLTLTLSATVPATTETLFLAFWAAAVFTPLAFLETARRPVHAGLALAVTLLVTTLPRSGGLRSAAVAALLALSVLIFAGLELGAPDRSPASAPAPRSRWRWRSCCTGTVSTWTASRSPRSSCSASCRSRRGGRRAARGRRRAGRAAPGDRLALALLLAPQLAAEPWWVGLVFATAALRVRLRIRGGGAARAARPLPVRRGDAPRRQLPLAARRTGRDAARRRGGARPRRWRRAPSGERVVVLTQASPRLEVELSGVAVGSLVVDSYLTHGVELACGQELAGLELADARRMSTGRRRAGRRLPGARALVAGRDSAEWAAGRPDVAARLACPAPLPWISWIPGAGRFLGQTTRARFELPQALGARRLVLERHPGLPAETSLAIFFLATER